jgi:hypothetical protein
MSSPRFRTGLAAFLVLTATAAPAHAYIDPGTGSIVLQALIGAVAAGMVVWRGYVARFVAWVKVVAAPANRHTRPPSE